MVQTVKCFRISVLTVTNITMFGSDTFSSCYLTVDRRAETCSHASQRCGLIVLSPVSDWLLRSGLCGAGLFVLVAGDGS